MLTSSPTRVRNSVYVKYPNWTMSEKPLYGLPPTIKAKGDQNIYQLKN